MPDRSTNNIRESANHEARIVRLEKDMIMLHNELKEDRQQRETVDRERINFMARTDERLANIDTKLVNGAEKFDTLSNSITHMPLRFAETIKQTVEEQITNEKGRTLLKYSRTFLLAVATGLGGALVHWLISR